MTRRSKLKSVRRRSKSPRRRSKKSQRARTAIQKSIETLEIAAASDPTKTQQWLSTMGPVALATVAAAGAAYYFGYTPEYIAEWFKHNAPTPENVTKLFASQAPVATKASTSPKPSRVEVSNATKTIAMTGLTTMTAGAMAFLGKHIPGMQLAWQLRNIPK